MAGEDLTEKLKNYFLKFPYNYVYYYLPQNKAHAALQLHAAL